MTRTEINVLRANIIGGMDTYVREVIGDDDVTDYWLQYGLPDGSTEDDLMADVDDEETFNSYVWCFRKCIRMSRDEWE